MALSERNALNLWRNTLVEIVRSDAPDLTARQQALLAVIALEAGPHTVRGLARGLNVAKPAITRGIDALERCGFVRRIPDEDDLRSVFVERTVSGMDHLRTLATMMRRASGEDVPVSHQPDVYDQDLDRAASAAAA
ncbi:MAG: MarR family transcriptional regulator [Pseudomonadota bacterium]